jgi:integrase
MTPGDMVLRLADGRPPAEETYRQALRRAAVRAGIGHVNPHDLRHTHASHLLAAGLPTFEVARRLGDSERTVSAVYGHLVAPMRGGAEAVAALMARVEAPGSGEVVALGG